MAAKPKWTIIAKRWSHLRLLDTEPEFRGLCPFPDEQSAREAVLHVCARSEEFCRRWDGWLILVVPLHSAILIGKPASLRARTAA
jgi:hypothetical protein